MHQQQHERVKALFEALAQDSKLCPWKDIGVNEGEVSKFCNICTVDAMELLNLSMQPAGPYGSACPLTSRLQFHTLSFLNPADLQTVRALGIASRESTRCMFSTPISHACSFCLHPARRRCRACWTAFYCCREHQAGHWMIHAVSCCVFQEQRKPIVFPSRRNHWFT